MADLAMRRKLAQDLRQLVAGSISNYDFDDSYCDHYADSDDATVRELGEYGYSLYSDNRMYRLRGRDAVDQETRAAVARCVLMLRARLDYSWPPPPRTIMREFADAFVLLGIAAGAAVTIIWSMLLVTATKDVEFVTPLGVAGVVLLACSIWHLGFGRRYSQDSPAWNEWKASGDYEVWPFLRRTDFDAARLNPSALFLAKMGRDGET
jgi:hypothetical protein